MKRAFNYSLFYITAIAVMFIVGVTMAFALEHKSYPNGSECVENREQAAMNLVLQWGETLVDTVTRPDGAVVEFYLNPSSGTYTVVQVTGENTGCMIGSGKGYTPDAIIPGYND